ncbi:unnamed protein product [Clonostachys rhizophaga]|uniref:Fatty acid desaturase domain-containing protein n=1 Tax=Clonostachys rhizophaga TaxID=160324 RepID=A0A9N9YX22_9HYPO|nr:unnamed protein product [Clonostachys rhizophaga]
MSLKEKPSGVDSRHDEVPDIKVLRNSIPTHCFEPSALKSLAYLIRDFVMAGALLVAASRLIPIIPSPGIRAATWVLYGFTQGLIGTGLWILAHEAGHGAFSKYSRLNDLVGWITHSALLVPYFSWKFSHHRHHLFAGHLDKDMAFVPEIRDSHSQNAYVSVIGSDLLEDIPIVQFVRLIVHQLIGWPLYLFFNTSAGKGSLQRPTSNAFRKSHFDPFSAVFRRSEAIYVVYSDIGVGLMLALLYWAWEKVGFLTLMLLYGQPYLWVHHWLIAITYLHHTHMDVPHFRADGWTFVKGALATVDRDFGFIGRHIFHGIIEYHVVHHLFPRIPFYHCEEATEAIKPLLGRLYRRDNSPFLWQLWTTFNSCKFVEDDAEEPGAAKWAREG